MSTKNRKTEPDQSQTGGDKTKKPRKRKPRKKSPEVLPEPTIEKKALLNQEAPSVPSPRYRKIETEAQKPQVRENPPQINDFVLKRRNKRFL